ncbi:MAG: Hsp70 family protein [Opitutaceae bacterium]|nr:Hsp70 family protein [Opitutaceae bacterium]
MRATAFGIDFGTTNSIVCAWGQNWLAEKRPVAFWDATSAGNRPHPSVVWYGPHGKPIVGREARQNMGAMANGMGHAFVASVKRKLGNNKEVGLVGGDRKAAWEVAVEIFRHLKEHAESREAMVRSGQKLTECVVTIPVGYDGRQRNEIRRAMQKAGLKLQTFLHEPFAAMVSHFYDPVQKLQGVSGKRTLVFDWGGGTLDVCLVEVSNDGSSVFELSHDGIADRAGDEFDQRMMSLITRKFLSRSPGGPTDLPIRGHALDRFRMAAEVSKIHLSSSLQHVVEVPSLFEAFGKLHDLEEAVTRAEFEEIAHDEIVAAEACVMRCLRAGGITENLVDQILLVGGTSNIPAVRSMMERIFGARVVVAFEPDAAIARGAAIVAAEGWVPYNVNDIGVVLADQSLFTILPSGAPLTASESKRYSFYCVDPRDGMARLILGERPRKGDRALRYLGDPLTISTPNVIENAGSLDRINAQFVVTEDATLRVTAQSAATGQEAAAEIHEVCFGLRIK